MMVGFKKKTVSIERVAARNGGCLEGAAAHQRQPGILECCCKWGPAHGRAGVCASCRGQLGSMLCSRLLRTHRIAGAPKAPRLYRCIPQTPLETCL